MQAQEISIANQISSLSISEQLVYLVESTSENNLDDYSREHYLLAVITGCIADLFILNKIHFGSSRIILNNNPKQVSDYLTDIMKKILSTRDEKSIFYILLDMNEQQMSKIESKIVKDLIAKKWLVREHEGPFILGKRYLQANDDELRINLYNALKNDLNANGELPEKVMFLLTLLDEIDFLPKLFESKEELEYCRSHLQINIKHDRIAKLFSREIQNELKFNEIEHMTKHHGGGLDIGRIF